MAERSILARSWLGYYGRLLGISVKLLLGVHERLVSIGALIVLALPALAPRINESLPSWPWWVTLLLWLLFMLGYANWNEVKARDDIIDGAVSRDAATYDLLVRYEEAANILLSNGPTGDAESARWSGAVMTLTNGLIAALAPPRLARHEYSRLITVETTKFQYERKALCSAEAAKHWVALKERTNILRELAADYAPRRIGAVKVS